jgi:hypothetical protein
MPDLLDGVPLLRLARALGEAGAQQCADAAERRGWDSAGAQRFVVGWLRRHGPTSGEDLVQAAEEHGYRPQDGRAFGAVLGALARRQEIRCVRADLPRRHGHGTSGGRLWEAT